MIHATALDQAGLAANVSRERHGGSDEHGRDAFVSCWQTKYTFWTARPFQRIPGLVTVITTPNFPTYTSGHSTISAAAAVVLGAIVPAERAFFQSEAEEAAMSRLYGGIHVRHDNEQGLIIGRRIGERAVRTLRRDRLDGGVQPVTAALGR